MWPTRGGDVVNFSFEGRRRRMQTTSPELPEGFPSRAAVFSAGGHLSPWVPKLLMLGGDIESNPGPKTYICRICKSLINKCQISVQCNIRSKHWLHLKCSGIRLREYSPTYTCPLHIDHDSDENNNNLSLTSTSTTTAKPDSPNQTASPSHSTDPQTTTDSDPPTSPSQSSSSTDTSTYR